MEQLEMSIKQRPVYEKQREDRIARLHKDLRVARNDTVRFDTYQKLLDEYKYYNSDSALNYARRRVELADRLGEPNFQVHSRLDEAEVLIIAGMYSEARDILSGIRREEVPDYLVPFHNHVMRSLYARMSEYALRPQDRDRYTALADSCQRVFMATVDTASLIYAIVTADNLNTHGKYRESVDELEGYLKDHKCSIHDYAMSACTLAFAYRGLGDRKKEKEYFIRSATSDMQSAVMDHMSLAELAMILYQEGDVERAHRFLQIAFDDAKRNNSTQRLLQITRVLPQINEVYVNTLQSKHRTQVWATVAISLLVVVLLGIMLLLRRQMRKTNAAKQEIQKANDAMHELNDALHKANDALNETNRDLVRANRQIADNAIIKEEYIARYMDMCSVNMEKTDANRKRWLKLLNARKFEELSLELKATSPMEDELRSFYESFDASFLTLFPTFVEDLNNLLTDDGRIVPKKEGQLNTELRVFALIRLGITDSVKIAQFLRYSLSTIYNYRTKVRNKARGERDRLEDEIMKIGRPKAPGDLR